MKQNNYGLQRFINLLLNPIFAVVWIGLASISFFTLDKPVALALHQISHSLIVQIAQVVTRLGLGTYYLLVSGIIFLLARYFLKCSRLAGEALFVFLSVAVSGIICDLIKITLGRTRPTELFHHQLYGFYFFQHKAAMLSFPSGHATTAASVMMALSLLWPKFWPGFISIAILVTASRVLITAHFISDVMVGFYLGSLTAIFFQRFLIAHQWLPGSSIQAYPKQKLEEG